jgi:Electron transfer DM13
MVFSGSCKSLAMPLELTQVRRLIMNSRRFVITTGLSFMVVSLLGCSKDATTQPSTATPTAASPAAATPATNSPSPATAQSAQATVLSSGSFVDGEHPTQGTVRLVKQNNQHRLELDAAFKTSSSGPDLVVILHRSADVIGSTTPPAFPIKEGDYVLLAPLKSYSGAQSYAIPNDLKLADFKSAAIWCRRFNATFGAATLKP